ncbi:toll-like receptor 5 [Xiphophorus maculatus]|uniref:toll-like receptor 5 n=1 Tax=Xiphophorus maculatus TaxID=8083 RepID=UPI000C6D5AF6|nr:toll-like receptor 5 [Xiphophorus maculatus]
MMMWTLGLQLVVVGVFLQMPGCFPSCLIKGSVAFCGFKNLHSVPPLPPHITHLFLENNRIGEINATSMSGLENLQELDLGNQKVPLVIRSNAFLRQSRLQRLVLGLNPRLQLEPLAFAGLSNLQKLHLDYCSLNESILTGNDLAPLSSLQTLNLYGNHIKRLRPSPFFSNMTDLTNLNLELNKIDEICESDLVGFKGKHFSLFSLKSVYLRNMLNKSFDWQKCGNPFSGVSFQTLDLSYSGLSVDKLRLFFRAISGTNISQLKVSGHIGKGFSFDNLPDPDLDFFEGLKNSSVRFLDLSMNRIFSLRQRVFTPLTEVNSIDLSQNKVNQIHRMAFEGLQGNLKMLNLSHNLLGEIFSHTFASLTNLEILDLSHNHIGVLGYGSFSELPNLRFLNLTDNSLQALGFPAALPNLENLNLNSNKLTSSSVNTITQLAHNVSSLSIQNNRITQIYSFLDQMKRLKLLLYGGNTIKWCILSRRVAPFNIKVLDLHSSSLQSIWSQGKCLNLFDKFQNVTSLNLSSNGLRSLPQGIFKGLTSVVTMDLSSNSLTYLQPDVLPKSLKSLYLSDNFIASPDPIAFSSLSFLDLSKNRFYCNNDLQSFLTWMKQTNIKFLSPIEEFRCEFPASFYNIPLLDYTGQLALRATKTIMNELIQNHIHI